jgi:hypothetical protein
MEVQFEKRPVKLNGETYLVPTHFFGENNAKHTLVLSPGFSAPGKYFDKSSYLLIQSMKDEGNIQIIVPEIIGRKIKSENGLIFQNNTHEKNGNLYHAFLNTLENVTAESFQSYCAQSSGPINFKSDKIILINPLVKVDYNRLGFILRAIKGSLIKELKFTITYNFGLNYSLEFLGNLQNNFACLDDLTSLKNDIVYTENRDANVLMMAGVNSKLKDQFFNYQNIEKILENKYYSFKFIPLFGGTHHSVFYEPHKFTEHIREHILK